MAGSRLGIVSPGEGLVGGRWQSYCADSDELEREDSELERGLRAD